MGDVGTSYGGTTHNLALHWNGSSWSRATTPGGNDYSLADVACPSSSSCWAVGTDETNNRSLNLALRMDRQRLVVFLTMTASQCGYCLTSKAAGAVASSIPASAR